MEMLGGPLPVLVSECLVKCCSCNTLDDVTVSIAASGWCWLVVGRRLLIWRYWRPSGTHESSTVTAQSMCYELQLPSSDVSHVGHLVQLVWRQGDAPASRRLPGCVTVSPSGCVRYWPSVARAAVSSQLNVDDELCGDECRLVSCLDRSRCLLVTSTCALLLLTIVDRDSDVSLQLRCRRINASSGLLSGIGRRVSSMFWGSLTTTSSSDESLVTMEVAPSLTGRSEPSDSFVYLLSSNQLQKWQLSESSSGMLYQWPVSKMAAESIADRVATGNVQLHDLKVLSDDSVGRSKCTLVILMSADCTSGGSQLFVGRLEDSNSGSPSAQQPQWLSFSNVQLPDTMNLIPSAPSGVNGRSVNLLVAEDDDKSVRVHTRRNIVCVDKSGGVEVLGLSSETEQILGAGISPDGRILYCTSHQGLIGSARAAGAASVLLSTPSVISAGARDKSLHSDAPQAADDWERVKKCLKTASVLFSRQQFPECGSVLQEMYAIENAAEKIALADAVVSLSTDIIDQYPTNDPRWIHLLEPGQSSETAGSSSVVISNQLLSKMDAHRAFLQFVRCESDSISMQQHLTAVWDEASGQSVDPVSVLGRHHELLVLALTLSKLPPPLARLLDTCLPRVVSPTPSPPLTNRDLFFRQVSIVDSALAAVVDAQTAALETVVASGGGGESARSVIDLVIDTARMLVAGVTAAWKCCEQADYALRQPRAEGCVDIPVVWCVSGPVCELLIAQHTALAKHALPLLTGGGGQSDGRLPAVLQLLVEVTDLLLAARRHQLFSTDHQSDVTAARSRYEAVRHDLLQPLLSAEQYERAASLAEKYEDFGVLIEVCERTGSVQRRQHYLQQYAGRGFSDCLFDYYLQRGQRGRLVDQCCGLDSEENGSFGGELRKQLQQHSALRWLAEFGDGLWNEAADTLKSCGLSEEQSLSRRRTYLCLAKLSCLAAGDESDANDGRIDVLRQQLDLVELQQHLCADEDSDQPVYTVEQLISVITDPENNCPNSVSVGTDELLFVRALELCQQLEDSEKTRLLVWRRALLRDLELITALGDSGDEENSGAVLDQPTDTSERLFLFRVALAARCGSLDRILHHLPSVDELLAGDQRLCQLAERPAIRYLLQAGYEQLITAS